MEAANHYLPYTEEDREFVTKNFQSLSNKELSEKLGRSIDAVRKFMKRIGLARTIQEAMAVAIKHTRNTWFKGGNPHNHRRVGTIAIRRDKRTGIPYKYIKLAEPNIWDLLHRVVWRKHFGEIETQDYITFKDGNAMNCEPRNLKKISRAECAVRNRWKDGYVPAKRVSKAKKKKIVQDVKKKVKAIVKARAQNKKKITRNKKYRSPDLKSLREVRINHKTTIYISQNKDPEMAKQKYLERHY